MNSAADKQPVEINWPAVFACILLPTLGLAAWTGIAYLVMQAMR